MPAKATTKKSQQIRENIALVQIVARTGRLPIVSDSEEFVAPGIPMRKIPGIVLEFGDNGLCELDPVRDAETIKAFREWIEDGTDPRIHELGVLEMAKDAVLPPYPKWDSSSVKHCLEMVDTLGLDAELALQYELGRGAEARQQLVKALEVKVDEPAPDHDAAEPVL